MGEFVEVNGKQVPGHTWAHQEARKWHEHELGILIGKLKTLPEVRHQVAIKAYQWHIPDPWGAPIRTLPQSADPGAKLKCSGLELGVDGGHIACVAFVTPSRTGELLFKHLQRHYFINEKQTPIWRIRRLARNLPGAEYFNVRFVSAIGMRFNNTPIPVVRERQ